MQKKHNSHKEKKEFYSQSIIDTDLLEIIEKAILFSIPRGGVHKPTIWRTKNGWGISYKIFATRNINKIGDKNKEKMTVNLKWKANKSNLHPSNGYEEFITTIPSFIFNRFVDLYKKMPVPEFPSPPKKKIPFTDILTKEEYESLLARLKASKEGKIITNNTTIKP